MKNRTTMIVALALFALVVATVPAALAAPADICDRNQNHPSCSDTEPPTEPPTVQHCETVKTLHGPGNLEFECDWTPQDNGATTGIVTVNVTKGKVSSVAVFVRDSAPGDICIGEQWDNVTETEFIAEFPLETTDGTYWDDRINWCAQFDTVAGQRSDLNGEPLHVFVSVRAKKDTVVQVSLSPGQA
jgi:hypothetical protein